MISSHIDSTNNFIEFQVTWWKPWKPDPTTPTSFNPTTTAEPTTAGPTTTPGSTTTRDPNAAIVPVDPLNINCDIKYFWPHPDCDKVRNAFRLFTFFQVTFLMSIF